MKSVLLIAFLVAVSGHSKNLWFESVGDLGLAPLQIISIALFVVALRGQGLGIALLVRTLRVACFHVVVRLRSVTRDWGLGIGDLY